MFLTALQPPPPTPITLMMPCIVSFTGPKSNISSPIPQNITAAKIQINSQTNESIPSRKPCEDQLFFSQGNNHTYILLKLSPIWFQNILENE
jgi:hypothetical protein